VQVSYILAGRLSGSVTVSGDFAAEVPFFMLSSFYITCNMKFLHPV